MSYIEFRNVSKTYKTGSVEVHALDNCEFFIEKGELCVIVGQSGAGKTTLLNILGGMDHLTTGQVFLDGREISALQTRELAKFRRENVGFVFQFYNLISNLTAYENVEMAAQLVKDPIDCDLLMNEVGLAETTSPHSCRAASSKGLPSREQSPRIRSSCCATSLPALSITRRASRSFTCSSTCRPIRR